MKKLNFLLTLAFIIVVQLSAQTKVGDATLPNEVTFNQEKLVLNGAGIREKFFFDIYAGGLYLKTKTTDAESIANADETMAVKLDILSGMMSRSKMEGALREGFEKATNNNTASLATRIDKFINLMQEEIEVGQVYDIVYEKGKGSVLYKNGVEKGFVEGLDFKTALFNIWLGKKPADKDLKSEMLGK
ncbi:chalcone isomerase family protein [Aquimarina sp. ERC-38]|uniref:chalcone isomerase family protein n=1 Tax=Aquimarina sp. ERC-38 TaxID=2949996 RepID=UPI0022458F6C|nr:chalcone isomerase family protein [Aquimarina sp. ERC-38]UZO80068.1 chalcone isomerase family protein [Aquimarina sp. ERC-38]